MQRLYTTSLAHAASKKPLILDRDDPIAAARAFLTEHHTRDGRVLLRSYVGLYRRWNGSIYEGGLPSIENAIWLFLDTAVARGTGGDLERFKPRSKQIAEILLALRALTDMPEGWPEFREGVTVCD